MQKRDIYNLIPERGFIHMKGQAGLSVFLIVVIAIGAVMLVLTQIRAPSGGGVLPDPLAQEISSIQENEKRSLKERLGINIEGDLDIVHLAFGNPSTPFTLVYNKYEEFIVTVPDPTKETAVRETVAKWFADRGIDLDEVNIKWHIKPNPVAFPD